MPQLSATQMQRAQANISALTGRGVSAREAANSAEEFARNMNGRNFQVDNVPIAIEKWARENPVRIFNVGPWPQRVMLGTLGSFFIPACPEGKEHVEMTRTDPDGTVRPALDGLVMEPIKEDGRMSVRQHDAREIANDIIGVGFGHAPQNSLLKLGIFVAAGPEPTKEEFAEAHKRLRAYLESLVKDARKAEQDGKIGEVVGPDHYLAARILKLNPSAEGWLKAQTVQTNEECPGCGTPYKKGVAVCRECKTILDEAKYKTLKRAE